MADISQVKLPNGDTYNLVDETSGYIKSYTETDPIFSASVASGITATDISNWNAKVSDDKTWNGVTFSNNTTTTSDNANGYVPFFETSSSTTTKLIQMVSNQTGANAAYKLARYNSSGYLISTTPSANNNSTKVATTAYVDAAIPKVYSSTNTGGYLTMATLPIYDGTVV